MLDGVALGMKRARKMASICERITEIPSTHASLYLLRYQASRMTYTLRTTPSAICSGAVAAADRAVQAAAECILGAALTPDQAERAQMPTRLGGLGLQSTAPCDRHFEEAAHRLSSRLPGGRVELDSITDDDGGFRQQRVTLAVRAAHADRLMRNMNVLDRATFQAHRAP